MAYCRSAGQFCCGFSVEFGVNVVLLFHLLRSLVCIVETALVVVFRSSDYDYFSVGRTPLIALSGFALAGVPLILGALWGVQNKLEAPLRLYWFYMLLAFLLDEGLTARALLTAGPCDRLPAEAAVQSGRAFQCGAIRALDFLSVATLTGIEAYFLYIVASHCENLRAGGGADLADLSRTSLEDVRQAQSWQSYYGAGEAVGGYGSLAAAGDVQLPTDFGGIGGSKKIFGKRHDLCYPPVAVGFPK